MNVAPLESPLAASPLMSGISDLDSALALGITPMGIGADEINRFTAPQQSANPSQNQFSPQTLSSNVEQMYDPMGSMLQQLMQMMQTLMSSLGLGSQYGSGYGSSYGNGYGNGYGSGYGSGYPGGCGNGGPGCTTFGNEQYYNSATGGSQGDPHLSFNGNTWDNMTSQPNLLQSNSFPGGYNVSTQVTPPSQNGITYNQSATVSLNGGATTISLNNQGQASIQEYGQNVAISPGQSVQLGNGESVTCNQNGSLTVQAQNGQGGQITTTLTHSGQGVNVNVNAQNVDLGGSLVNGAGYGNQPNPIPPPPPVTIRPQGITT